jgi:hypothetical protein
MNAEMSPGSVRIVAAAIVATIVALVVFVAPRTGQPGFDGDGGN